MGNTMSPRQIINVLFIFSLFYSVQTSIVKSTDFCGSNKDCNSANYCNLKFHKCVHLPLKDINTIQIVGLFVLQIILILTNSAGVQGGAVILPILVYMFDFEVKEAIPIIKTMSFFGGLTYFLLHLTRKHPNRDAPVVEFSAVLMISPLLLVGTMTGLNVSIAVPSWMILIMSTAFIIYFIYKTFYKGTTEFQKEQKIRAEAARLAEEQNSILPQNEQIPEIKEKVEKGKGEKVKTDEVTTKYASKYDELNEEYEEEEEDVKDEDSHCLDLIHGGEYEKEIAEIEESMKPLVPWRKALFLGGLIITFVFFTFLRGSNYVNSFAGIKSCSSYYWIVYGSFVLLSLTLAGLVGWYLNYHHKRKCEIGFPFVEHDLHWNWKLVIILASYSLVIGMVATVGVGSSLMTVPLMLEIGLTHEQGSSSNALINIMTGSTISIEFIASGLLSYDWALLLSVANIIGAFTAVFVVRNLLLKFGRMSIQIFLLGGVLCAGCGLIIYKTVLNFEMIHKRGLSIWAFAKPC